MSVKSFSQFLTEEKGKEVTFCWGRYNPPTVGHEKLMDAVKSKANGDYFIYASQSQNNKKDPLDYTTKVKYMRKMFPRHARAIILDKAVRTIFDLLTKLYDQGYTKANLVAGSDRVPEYAALVNKYNGVKGRHGFYNFEGGVNVISAGQRDPDADGVEGMSGTKLRAYVTDNNFAEFSKVMPKGFKDAQTLFNDVRKGLGLSESRSFREHIQFEAVSEAREAYVSGDLYDKGDDVVIKETNEVVKILACGANYLIVESTEGKRVRCWLEDVEKLTE